MTTARNLRNPLCLLKICIHKDVGMGKVQNKIEKGLTHLEPRKDKVRTVNNGLDGIIGKSWLEKSSKVLEKANQDYKKRWWSGRDTTRTLRWLPGGERWPASAMGRGRMVGAKGSLEQGRSLTLSYRPRHHNHHQT